MTKFDMATRGGGACFRGSATPYPKGQYPGQTAGRRWGPKLLGDAWG